MDKYKTNLLNCSSKLDAVTDSCGELVKLAMAIIDEESDEAALALLRKISEIADNEQFSVEVKKIANSLKECIIKHYGYLKVTEICRKEKSSNTDIRTLTELLNELNSLVGLNNVKAKVNDLITYQKVQRMRRELNLHTAKSTLHMAFTGNPGTGKTTVARIVGRIYKQIGLLSSGHFVEVSRTDLIAGYQGQTALKVHKVIEQAKGGVLFIDEAYSITENENSDSYGRECLTELTKALEDYREDLVVIVAGYTEPMHLFFESNPGLKSRFNTFIEFPDYSYGELMEILLLICKSNDYFLSDNAKLKLTNYFEEQIETKTENFANGRVARNIYDDLVMNHARRIVKKDSATRIELSEIIDDDFIV